MSYSSCLKGFFLACLIGFALTARLAFALPISLFGPLGGLVDYANELAILVALLAASRLTGRLKSYYAKRTVLGLLEEGWVKWTDELEARKVALPRHLSRSLRRSREWREVPVRAGL